MRGRRYSPVRFQRAVPELPAELERHGGLAGAGGHGEQQSPLALEDGFHGPVDGDLRVVPLALADFVVERREQAVGDCLVVDACRAR